MTEKHRIWFFFYQISARSVLKWNWTLITRRHIFSVRNITNVWCVYFSKWQNHHYETPRNSCYEKKDVPCDFWYGTFHLSKGKIARKNSTKPTHVKHIKSVIDSSSSPTRDYYHQCIFSHIDIHKKMFLANDVTVAWTKYCTFYAWWNFLF